jgi:hypothetical protein
MLKSKDSYSSETAYNRAFFLHNSHVVDYPVDPTVNSFIRVIRPHEDQPIPEDKKGYHNRPQIVFFGNGACSRFYELTDAPKLRYHLETMMDVLNRVPGGVTINGQDVFSTRQQSIFFKTAGIDDGTAFLVAHAPARSESYKLAVKDNLLDVMSRIVNNVPPQSDILHIEDMMMSVIGYPGNGVRDPILISGRKMTDRKVNYMSLRRDKGCLAGPSSETHDVVGYFTSFLDSMKEASEQVLEHPELNRCVRFVGEQDVNMEYVNACYIDTTTGPSVEVMLNSDRYLSNRKLVLNYRPEFHDQFRSRMVNFCEQFAAL